jgi:hypothetical protein
LETIILQDIPFQPDPEALQKSLRIRPGSPYQQDFQHMLAEAAAGAHPKALYCLAFIDEKQDERVIIAGRTFTSRVLRVNLEKAQRVFAYAATCGLELDEWSAGITDLLFSFWADGIKQAALHKALEYLYQTLDERFALSGAADMNPGSLEDWPLQEQAILFDLLGDTQAAIGLQLTESCLMLPTKSVSGVRFPLGETFQSCQLCPRPICPNRRAPYDADLYKTKYQLDPTG